jgi:aminoglycoside 6-adenylyltransferase
MTELEATATRWAEKRADVHALLLLGSRARTDEPADEWSDHDFVVVVDDDDPFLRSDAWVAELGPALLSFVEEAATGGVRERRVLFTDGNDADFTVLPLTDLERVLARPDVASVFARGFRVLVDKAVLKDLPTAGSPPPDDYAALVQEFWYRAILTARKLRRGELHVAVQGCNCGMRTLLQRALALEARAAGRDPLHGGRFFERWVDPRWRARMAGTVAQEHESQAAAAIHAACELFTDVCRTLQETHGLEVAIELPAIRRQLDTVMPPPRRRTSERA